MPFLDDRDALPRPPAAQSVSTLGLSEVYIRQTCCELRADAPVLERDRANKPLMSRWLSFLWSDRHLDDIAKMRTILDIPVWDET